MTKIKINYLSFLDNKVLVVHYKVFSSSLYLAKNILDIDFLDSSYIEEDKSFNFIDTFDNLNDLIIEADDITINAKFKRNISENEYNELINDLVKQINELLKESKDLEPEVFEKFEDHVIYDNLLDRCYNSFFSKLHKQPLIYNYFNENKLNFRPVIVFEGMEIQDIQPYIEEDITYEEKRESYQTLTEPKREG